MDLNWILEDPIDFEYKQYLLLDYEKKVNEKLAKFEIYPTFQEVTLHLANITRINKNNQTLVLNKKPVEVDDEILVKDLDFKPIKNKTPEEIKEIKKLSQYAHTKFTEMFMVAKSLWSLIYDAVQIEIVKNRDFLKAGWGYFYLYYHNEFYVYEYNINRIDDSVLENKCFIRNIYQGEFRSVDSIIIEYGSYGPNGIYSAEHMGLNYPIFKVEYSEDYPLEGALLSLTRRKIMSFIFQSVKIQKIRE
jgi:hypothetical protein